MEFEGLQRNRKIPSLTPLIDIVFLLLVFFMLTAHFVKDEVMDITLPEAETGAAIEDNDMVEVVLSKNGEIHINNQLVNIDEIDKKISRLLTKSKSKQVVVRGDKAAQIGLMVKVMDAARKAGVELLEVMTTKK